MFKTEIKGLKELQVKLEQYDKNLANKIDEQLSIGAENIAVLAKSKAPVGRSGKLGASISADVSQRFSKSISVGVPYGAFVEFGTGSKVFKTPEFNFTPEMKAYALEFFVSGKGKQPASPFLFPSLEIEKKRIIFRIKEVLFGKGGKL
jgi:HK97 gp10 family phage protein